MSKDYPIPVLLPHTLHLEDIPQTILHKAMPLTRMMSLVHHLQILLFQEEVAPGGTRTLGGVNGTRALGGTRALAGTRNVAGTRNLGVKDSGIRSQATGVI